MNALISVIIPIYNMEQYLERCLDSVLNNTYRNLEVICIDDGSTDRSAEILRRYKEKDPRIVVITKENGGVSSARNAGLDRMTGEYVTFIDPDDYVHPQYVELLYRALLECGTRISCCFFQTVESDLPQNQAEEIIYDSIDAQMYSFSRIFREHKLRAYSGGRMIHSSLLKDLKFRDNMRYGEDTVFFSEICEREETKIVPFLSYPLYYYFQREDSLTKTADSQEIKLYLKSIVANLLNSNIHDEIYLDNGVRSCLHHRYIFSHIHNDKKDAHECDHLLKRMQGRIWKTKEYGTSRKILILFLIHFPWLYWLYRVVRDPSMWAWEKTERKKRREERRKKHTSQ